MSSAATVRSYGSAFDRVASDYDRRRPAYPDEIVERACAAAGLRSGDRVLELGCGSGQLTQALLARGLRVTAVEPGASLLALARGKLAGRGELELINARFEDAPAMRERFAAVFCASAFHWIDPDVSWRKAADSLARGGTLALIQHFGLQERHSLSDQEALLAAIARVAPEIAAAWPTYRDLPTILAGSARRRSDVSEVWSWLGRYELARPCAGRLFGEVEIALTPLRSEHTAAELNALMATTSIYARLSARQRGALERETDELHRRLGRPIRSSTAAVAVTARRTALR
ncbi:MAG TPA: class I SAM-dependent methyltransferase [Solirubrobacteraceae bacterium]|nr:class I SAM-dependent methyltransferase [Solirubrobacteraceae bacterium]